MTEKCCAGLPEGWAVYEGTDGFTQYICLAGVVGVKFDPAANTVTLRLSNGNFVNVAEALDKVLCDLSRVQCRC